LPEYETAASTPDKKWLAYQTGSIDEIGEYPEGGLVLHIMNMASGEAWDLFDLLPADYPSRLDRLVKQSNATSCGPNDSWCLKGALSYLMGSVQSMVWSPDGKYLAFGAMVDGDSADIYTYDIDTGQIRKMENGPGNPGSFHWSPDGNWLTYVDNDIYEPIQSALMAMEGRWAVPREGGIPKKLHGPFTFNTWISDHEYLGHWAADTIHDAGPTLVDVETGNTFNNFDGLYTSIAVDPRSRMMAVVGSRECTTGSDCHSGRKSGLYLGSIYGTLDYKADYSVLEKNIRDYDPIVMPRGGTIHPFFVSSGAYVTFVGITPEGRIDPLDVNLSFGNIPLISQNYWMALFPTWGIRVYDPSDRLRFELSNDQNISFDTALWDTNSKGLFYPVWEGGSYTMYYWRLGATTPRRIIDNSTNGYIALDLFVNIRDLPRLRIIPARAAKPMEGTSIWSQTKYKELFQPGTNRYDVAIPAYSSWRWSFSLGTTDPGLFEKILAPEDVEFRINGQVIDANMFRMTDQTAEGRFSRAWAAMLSGWRAGDRAELEIKYTLREAVRDGNVEYPAGEYRQIIEVVVE
jgi:hypothetical protein